MRKSRGYWKNFGNIKNETLNFVAEHGIEKLTYKDLKEMGKHDFINGIKREGLSLKDICQSLNLPVLFTPKGYLQNIDNVLYEVKLLIDRYGCFPNRDVLLSIGKSALEGAMVRYGGRDRIFKMLGYEHNSRSLLEQSVKTILDELVEDEYIDNARKLLRKYGLNLQNPKTGQHFEIDRYYYNARVAIEIQGQQHYKAGGNQVWTKERLQKMIESDQIKRKMLADQGVTLVTIPHNKCSEQDILNQLKCIGELKLREFGETPEMMDNTEPSLIDQEGVTTSSKATSQ